MIIPTPQYIVFLLFFNAVWSHHFEELSLKIDRRSHMHSVKWDLMFSTSIVFICHHTTHLLDAEEEFFTILNTEKPLPSVLEFVIKSEQKCFLWVKLFVSQKRATCLFY